MQCPIDNATLAITERQGVEIDYCPECRGVWLDRGELDKIIDKSGSFQAPSSQPQPQPETYRQPEQRQHYDDRHQSQPKHKKRENFLGDLFDF